MPTSNGADLPFQPGRGSLRLRLVEHPGRNRVDGGWWPRSRDLALELADLVDHFPLRFGKVGKVSASRPDWVATPTRVAVADGYVKVGWLPQADSHVVRLKTADRAVLYLLVVPPDFTDAQGAEALLAASTNRNKHCARDILDLVTEHPDVDPADHWTDSGGTWWEPHDVAPSFRPGR
ncbi:DUF5994 family protein [Nocardioides sp. SLBN-35]|uniref:DUF5994 family protein n=1 Tax=Nocardioides sp. SLBN-35 TaxID=2768445 RepID=UPI001153F603|nr:DUF5994 family protein [Nocardioides sp. SLBN-35]